MIDVVGIVHIVGRTQQFGLGIAVSFGDRVGSDSGILYHTAEWCINLRNFATLVSVLHNSNA